MANKLFHHLNRAVYVSIPSLFDDGNPRRYRLVAIDDAGLWLENEELLERLVRTDARHAARERLVAFVPYAQITCLFELPEAEPPPQRPPPSERATRPAPGAKRKR